MHVYSLAYAAGHNHQPICGRCVAAVHSYHPQVFWCYPDSDLSASTTPQSTKNKEG